LWDAASPYVRSKYLGEQAARSWNGNGLEVVVVKPTAPVGAGDARPSPTGRRIRALLDGTAFSYPPGGANHAPVTDIAAGHLLAAVRGEPGGCYILGHAGGNLNAAHFIDLVREAATRPLPPAKLTSAGLLESLTVNPERAVRELGLPQSSLVTAFRDAVRWYEASGKSAPGAGGPVGTTSAPHNRP
jgi:dihydroflavonol-4-reductase